jgi:hypothetical protein
MKRKVAMKTAACVLGCVMASRIGHSETNAAAFSLWQLPGQTKSQMNSYVIQTTGNEIIVIDGGTEGDAGYLREFIRDMGNRVHAWFISHPHSDHVDAQTAILDKPDGIEIDALYGSLPDEAWMKKHQDGGAFKTLQELNSAVKKNNQKVLEFSPGQKIEFKGVTFEILAVRNPELTANAVNNQSAVWRVDGGGESILFLGDLGMEGGEKLLSNSCSSRLKADYVQMAHHGQTGVSEEFYKTVNPKYLLWPTPDWLWENDNGKGRNSGPWRTLEVRAWMEELNIEKHYIAKDGLHRIDFPTQKSTAENRLQNN